MFHLPSQNHSYLLLSIYMAAGESFSILLSRKQPFHMFSPRYVSGNISSFPVEDFVKGSNYGLLSVAIQYRLGVFGELWIADSIWRTGGSLKHLAGFLPGQKIKDGGILNAGLREFLSVQPIIAVDSRISLSWSKLCLAMGSKTCMSNFFSPPHT